jgi:hypothetical protein
MRGILLPFDKTGLTLAVLFGAFSASAPCSAARPPDASGPNVVVSPEGPRFSVERGFFERPFDLTVSSDFAGAVIRYTLDGSDPRTSPTAAEKQSPAVIRIDPSSAERRSATPAVPVRAFALVDGVAVTSVGADTYIFLPAVKIQTRPGPDWPVGRINGRALDYDMDPDVVESPLYRTRISAALLDIPSYCVNTDLGSVFDPDTGIYVNPLGRGREWERAASIELIDPKSREPGFQINGGLRLRGGYSRIGDQPKAAFRLFFRAEYGRSKLEYPLFQDEGVSSFDCVDLRTAQNYSWSYQGRSGHVGIFIRDVFSRDTQRDMGRPYTRSRACHLFLDGMYWGLYQTQERSEASYAESYFGGDKDDYDVVKVDPERGGIEATDGTPDAYNRLWSYSMAGFSSNEAYFRVQGRSGDGSVDWSLPVLVNVENLADYLLIIYFTGNFDSPVSAFGQNRSVNNFYGICDRLGREGFLFFIHDAEHALMDPRYFEPNPMNDYGYDRTGPYPCGDQRSMFNPQWLHQKLSENPEYLVAFSDRVYRHFFNRGALTPDACRARMAVRRDEIDPAVIAESARWGDSKVHPPRTRDNDWLPSVNWVMDEFFPGRGEIVLGQLARDGLYPSVNPPVFRSGTEDILDASWSAAAGSPLTLVNPNAGGAGTIWYTADGTDPRLIGGSENPAAANGGDGAVFPVTSTLVLKARVKNGSVWSALHELLIEAGPVQAGLAITEILYRPLPDGDVDGGEFEFLELKNRSGSIMSLSGVRFTNGVEYAFPAGAEIPAGGFWVIASNAAMFRKRYGFAAQGEYSGQLDNAGERLRLVGASGDTLIDIRYNDKSPWPEAPDSTGQSLVVRNFALESNPDNAGFWTASSAVNGSPGADDGATGVEERSVQVPSGFELDQNYPNPFNPSTRIRFAIPAAGFVRLIVTDILGREAAVLAEGYFQAGPHHIEWDASGLPAGVYMCRLEAGGVSCVRKMVLVK